MESAPSASGSPSKPGMLMGRQVASADRIFLSSRGLYPPRTAKLLLDVEPELSHCPQSPQSLRSLRLNDSPSRISPPRRLAYGSRFSSRSCSSPPSLADLKPHTSIIPLPDGFFPPLCQPIMPPAQPRRLPPMKVGTPAPRRFIAVPALRTGSRPETQLRQASIQLGSLTPAARALIRGRSSRLTRWLSDADGMATPSMGCISRFPAAQAAR